VAIIARLSLLGCVDAEQSDALLAEPNGIAIRDREAVRASRAVGSRRWPSSSSH
jgi:hypothetical protein